MDGITQPVLQVCALPALWLDVGARLGMRTCVSVCAPLSFGTCR